MDTSRDLIIRNKTKLGSDGISTPVVNTPFQIPSSSFRKYRALHRDPHLRPPYSITLVVPQPYNLNSSGLRRPIQGRKLDQTKSEIKLLFGGYTSHEIVGYYRNEHGTNGNSVHLFKSEGPANLVSRFMLVDLEAILFLIFQIATLLNYSLMIGPIPYIGGKNRIANAIIRLFPKHQTYVEPFAGGAQVFFHKEPSRVEVLNDLYGEVVNFYRVCQQHHEEFLRCLRFILISRKWHELFEKQNPETLTDIQRAARFFYLQKTSYAGLVRHQNYNYSVLGPPSFNPGRLPELIEETHKRLQRVQIECLPYETILERFDRPSTLFYLDPPYFGPKLYKFNFTEADFVTLEERLRRLKGKFVLSLNDVPEVREIFRRFHFKEIELAYTAQPEAGKRYHELLIANYPLREILKKARI